MKVTNLADACILFEHGGTRVLSDPWLGTPTYGSWLQYPPPSIAAADVGPLDYIYISHLHEDHCDFVTLAALDPTAPLLIMERSPNLLLDHLITNGIARERIICVPPRTGHTLRGDLIFEPIEPDPGHEYSRLVDSAMLLHWSGGSLYFANDSEPYPDSNEYIASKYRVELAMLPFYGGSGYPACYTNLTSEEKRAEVVRIRHAYLRSIERCLRTLQPTRVMPVASWHCFAGDRAHLNDYMCWPDSYDELASFVDGMGTAGPDLVLLSPGQSIDLDAGEHGGDSADRFSPADRARFASSRLVDHVPAWRHVPNPSAIRLERLFDAACANFKRRSGLEFPPGFRYVFDCREGVHYVLEPHPPSSYATPATPQLAEPYLKITLDRRQFALLLIGALSWNIEDVGGYLEYERVPNTYRPETYVALNYLKV